MDELNEAKIPASEEDEELVFLLEKKLYELQSWRLWNIEYQKKLSVEDSVLKITNPKDDNKSNNTIMQIDQELISQVLENIKSHYSMVKYKINALKSTLNE